MSARIDAGASPLLLLAVVVCAALSCAEAAQPASPTAENPAGSCRRRDPGKIVGGESASIGNWPGFAQLRARDSKGNLLYFCGGTLITPTVVLTAAHCVQRLEKNSAGDWSLPGRGVIEVLLATDDLRTARADHVRAVADRVIHEQWTGELREGNDIALLRLRTPWSGDRARLSDSAVADAAAQAFVAGFGLLSDRAQGSATITWNAPTGTVEAGSQVLREVLVPTVARAACSQSYPDLQPHQLCAGYEEGRKDSCHGDSGGPLNAMDDKQCPYQIGVVSYGDGCAKQKAYGVYTSVSPYLAWIRRKAADYRAVGERIVPEAGGLASSRALDELIGRIGNTPRKVSVTLQPSSRLRLGQMLSVEVASESSGRLLLLDENSRGEIVQLYPNVYVAAAAGRITPAAPLRIPAPGAGFSLKVLPPTGEGRLVAIVAPADISFDREISGASLLERAISSEAEPANYAMNIAQQIMTLLEQRVSPRDGSALSREEASRWSVAVRTYSIEP